MNNNKVKHLEFIHNTINRMARHSFLLKGWSIAVIGGLFAISFRELDQIYLYISGAVLGLFWLMDGFYFSRERLFIRLYDQVRSSNTESDFSMDITSFRNSYDWAKGVFSQTLVVFYGGLILVHAIILTTIIF